MALSDITQKILADAQAEAAQINAQAEKEAKTLEAEAHAKAEATKKRIEDETAQRERDMERKTHSLAQTERKSLLLSKKRALIEKVFAEAKKKLGALPAKELDELLVSFLTQITEKAGTVYPAAAHREAVQKALKVTGKHFTLGEEKDFAGGFVFVGVEAEVDFSFDSIIERDVRPQAEIAVTKTLFAD